MDDETHTTTAIADRELPSAHRRRWFAASLAIVCRRRWRWDQRRVACATTKRLLRECAGDGGGVTRHTNRQRLVAHERVEADLGAEAFSRIAS